MEFALYSRPRGCHLLCSGMGGTELCWNFLVLQSRSQECHRGLRVRLPPLRDHSRIKTDGAADEPTRDHVRLRLAVNRDRMEMENPGDLASSECPMIGAEDLRDQRWV